MKNFTFTFILLLVLMVTLTGNVGAMPQADLYPSAPVLMSLNSPDDLYHFSLTQLPLTLYPNSLHI